MTAAVPFDLPTLLDLRAHLSVVHHLPGRIRLRVGLGLWSRAARVDRDRLQQLLDGLEGIRALRVNPAAASLVIDYDPRQVPPDAWETLIRGERAAAGEVLSEWLARYGQRFRQL